MNEIPDNEIDIDLRESQAKDGYEVNQLIAHCKPLDENSVYCNLLQCSDFSGTCCVAESGGEIVGFVSAYRPPQRPTSLFVWQVAISEVARGQGLASRMLDEILSRTVCDDVQFVEASITADNKASWALFEGLARKHGTELVRSAMFDREVHFKGLHESELRATVGPLSKHE